MQILQAKMKHNYHFISTKEKKYELLYLNLKFGKWSLNKSKRVHKKGVRYFSLSSKGILVIQPDNNIIKMLIIKN